MAEGWARQKCKESGLPSTQKERILQDRVQPSSYTQRVEVQPAAQEAVASVGEAHSQLAAQDTSTDNAPR